MSATGRILLVGGSEPESRAISLLLQMDGITAHRVASADKAMACLSEQIDVVLCDIDLGALSGLDLMRLWHKQKPETLFVVLTSHGTIESAVAAIKAGAYEYLVKPIRRDKLIPLIRAAIEQPRKPEPVRSNRILPDNELIFWLEVR